MEGQGQGQAPRKRSFARRLARAGLIATVGLAVVVAALPWLASTPPARDAIVTRVNAAIAPSRVEVKGLSLSWFGAIRLTGVSLKNSAGKVLIDAERATTDRGLLALARDASQLGVVTLEGAAVDVERRADGSIDLVDALVPPRPADAPAPESVAVGPKAEAAATPDVTLRIARGKLRLATPELAEPLVADGFDMDVVLPAAADKKLSWRIRLTQPPGGNGTESLGIDGELDHHATGDADLSLTVKGSGWPLAVAASGVAARARLDGSMRAERASGSWASASNDLVLRALDASGPALNGDRLAFDRLGAVWDVSQSQGAWKVKTLGVTSPVGTLTGTGAVASGGGSAPEARVEARIDLAALAQRLPRTLHLRDGLTLEHGSARLLLKIESQADRQAATLDASVSDLAARDATHAFTLRDPAAVTLKASRSKEKMRLDALTVKTTFLDLTGSGDPTQGIVVHGAIDLAGLEAQFKELIDFGGLALAGKGRLVGDYRITKDGYLARFAAEVKGLKVAGLAAAPIERDAVRFDAAASGAADASCAPTDWRHARVNAIGGPDKVTLAGRVDGAITTLHASGALPLVFGQFDGRAEATVGARVTKAADGSVARADLDEVRAVLRPSDPRAAAAGAFGFAAKGALDLAGDDLTLAPLPLADGVPAVAAVAPEGLKYHGVFKTPFEKKAAKGAIVGELAAVEQALKVWTGREPAGYGGAFRFQVGAGPGDGRLNTGFTLSVADFTRPARDGKSRRSEGPVTLAFGGGYAPASDRITAEALALITRYGRIDAAGVVDDPTGRRVADLKGTIAPEWRAVSRLAAETVEPGVKLDGKARPFFVRGPLSGDSLAAVLQGLDAEVGVDLASAEAFGLRLGPAPVVVRGAKGSYTVDPIQTTLNNGRVTLLPGLDVDPARGVAVTLAPGSSIDGAEIDDEVSKRVLTYVAPVLDRATHVRGKIAMNVERADFPIVAPDGRGVTLTGRLVFQDVVFAPGPFAQELLTLSGRPDSPGLKLQQPVQLAVADGRVNQSGLEVPIGKGASVKLDGSVGFDETLALKASVPLTRGMLGARSGLDDVVGDRRIVVPIGGTVSRPKVDRRALEVALRELSKGVLTKEVARGAADLLKQLAPPAPAADGASPGAGAPNTDGGEMNLKGLEDQLLRRLGPRRR
jgi:translocation and assembly module TamB